MSKLRSINTAFWSDTWIEALEPTHKLLFLYLVTNDKTNMLGIYEASIRKISFETGIDIETVENALKGFERVKKVKYVNNYVILINYMKHQNYNTNMKKSAIDIYNNLPKELKNNNLKVSKNNASEGFETLLNHYGMVRKVEVEVEVEVEVKKEDEDEVKKEGFHNVDKLINVYLEDEILCNAIISNNDHKIRDKDHLKERLMEFKSNLEESGRHSETWKEFTSYFKNWNKIAKPKIKTINENKPEENLIYYYWKHEGRSNVRTINKNKAKTHFDNQEQGGYIPVIIKGTYE